MKFQHSAFIRRNTPELRKKLEELGYGLQFIWSKDDTVIQIGFGKYFTFPDGNYSGLQKIYTPDESLDCGTNESLFLAIAAIREDSDYMQWYYNNNGWFQCSENNIKYDVSVPTCIISDAKKATLEELEEHFKEL